MKNKIKYKYLALILAREGSLRLKNKNIKKLGDKPLISITLDNLIKLKTYFEDIVVSSDSEIIEKICKKKKIFFIKRPKYLSGSKISSETSALHAVKQYERNKCKINFVVLFQVTSPFRKNSTITKAIRISKNNPEKQIVSVSKSNRLKPNGLIYISPKNKLFRVKNFKYKQFYPMVTNDKTESLDIDTAEDFKKAQLLVKTTFS